MNLHGLIEAAWHASWFDKAFVLFAIATVSWGWFQSWRSHRLQELAENWPMTMGRIVSREVKERQGKNEGTTFAARLTYSYFQDGQQSGVYEKKFDSWDEAGAWLDLLYEKDVPVHFDPARPSRSTLLERELPTSAVIAQNTLTDSGAPLSLSGTTETSRWRAPLATASLIGLAACAVLHVLGIVDRSLSDGTRFAILFVMQVYAILAIWAASFLNREKLDRIASKRYRAELDAVTPETLRWTGKLIYLYGTGWFAAYGILIVLQRIGSGVPLATFSAFQAIVLFEAYRMTQMDRWRSETRSQRGHYVSKD